MEILTIAELAAMLKMNKRQIYLMTDTRIRTGSMKANPLPVLRINGNLRFRKSDVEAWIDKLAANGKRRGSSQPGIPNENMTYFICTLRQVIG